MLVRSLVESYNSKQVFVTQYLPLQKKPLRNKADFILSLLLYFDKRYEFFYLGSLRQNVTVKGCLLILLNVSLTLSFPSTYRQFQKNLLVNFIWIADKNISMPLTHFTCFYFSFYIKPNWSHMIFFFVRTSPRKSEQSFFISF